jgi:hypothetical protein
MLLAELLPLKVRGLPIHVTTQSTLLAVEPAELALLAVGSELRLALRPRLAPFDARPRETLVQSAGFAAQITRLPPGRLAIYGGPIRDSSNEGALFHVTPTPYVATRSQSTPVFATPNS